MCNVCSLYTYKKKSQLSVNYDNFLLINLYIQLKFVFRLVLIVTAFIIDQLSRLCLSLLSVLMTTNPFLHQIKTTH
jgi:hypothetical protein